MNHRHFKPSLHRNPRHKQPSQPPVPSGEAAGEVTRGLPVQGTWSQLWEEPVFGP